MAIHRAQEIFLNTEWPSCGIFIKQIIMFNILTAAFLKKIIFITLTPESQNWKASWEADYLSEIQRVCIF